MSHDIRLCYFLLTIYDNIMTMSDAEQELTNDERVTDNRVKTVYASGSIFRSSTIDIHIL